jgi:hypothetical protein
MGVPSRCTIVSAIGRSACAPEKLSERNKIQKPKRKKRIHFVSVNLPKTLTLPYRTSLAPLRFEVHLNHLTVSSEIGFRPKHFQISVQTFRQATYVVYALAPLKLGVSAHPNTQFSLYS